jgi:hypothetical protein
MKFKLNKDMLYFSLNYGCVHRAIDDDKHTGWRQAGDILTTFDELDNC